jgi:hypothetical protein
MFIRNFPFLVIILTLVFLSGELYAQQKVDLNKAEADNPALFSGGFFRTGIGFSRTNFNYAPAFEGVVLNPLHFHMDFGKRMNRKYGAYFSLSGNVQVGERELGFDLLKQWAHAGLHVGALFYFRGNSYFSPEVGLGILTFEYTEYQVPGSPQPYCMGINSALKYGYDRHVAGSVFVGAQAFISYGYTWETDVSTPANASSFLYGASLNLKFGK